MTEEDPNRAGSEVDESGDVSSTKTTDEILNELVQGYKGPKENAWLARDKRRENVEKAKHPLRPHPTGISSWERLMEGIEKSSSKGRF